MTFKELAELTLKEFPEGIWVHFNDDCPDTTRLESEHYLDEESMTDEYITDFTYVLDKEVKDYYIDECGYDVLEVFLK